MVNKPKLNIGYFFLSLGTLGTLIASVTSFLNLAFEVLNKKYPDILNATYQYGYNNYEFQNLRSYLATLIIIFPIFIVLAYFWRKKSKTEKGEMDNIIEKWIIYLVIFLSSLVIVVDLIALVRIFIAGEITERFILKASTAFFTALVVGGYYIILILGQKKRKLLLWILALVGIAMFVKVIIFSFIVMGSPFKQRELQLDERRVQDLRSIQGYIVNYWQQKEKLPSSLDDLKDPLSGVSLPVPPGFEKGEIYEYAKLEKMKFQLCGTFSLPMPKGWQEYQNYKGGITPMMGIAETRPDVSVGQGGMSAPISSDGLYYPYPWWGSTNESWDHQAGRTCFDRTIDPERYPPYKMMKSQ